MRKICKKLFSIAVTIAMCATILVPVNVSANTAGFDTWFSTLPTLTDQTVANIQADTTVNNANYAEFYDYPGQPYRLISTSPGSVKVSSNQGWTETGGNDRKAYAILKLDQVDDIYNTNKGTYVYDVDLNINLTGEDDRAPLSTSGGSRTNMNGVFIGFFGGTTEEGDPGYSVINLFRDKAIETAERVSNNSAAELATFAGDGLENGKYKMVYEYATGTSASEAKANIYMYKYNTDGVTYNTTPVMSVIGKTLKAMPGSTSKEQWSAQTKDSLGWIQIGVRTPHTGSSIEVTKASFGKMPESVTLSDATVSMEINATKQLSATVLPSNAINKNVTWTSSDNGVATVNENGLVTAVSSGTATITATTVSGGKIAECVVTVNEPAASSYSEWFSTLPTLTDQTVANIQANTRVNDANYAEFYDYPGQLYRLISTSPSSVKVSSIQSWTETGGNDRKGYAILKLAQVDDIYNTNKGTYVYDVDLNINLTGEGDRAPLSTSGGTRTNMNGVFIGFFGGTTEEGDPGYSVINLFRDKAIGTAERVSNNSAEELATFAGEGLENGKYKMVYEYATGTSASEAKANIYMYKYNADGVTYNTTPVMSVIGKTLKTMPGSTSKEQWSAQTKDSLGWIQIGVRTPHTGSSIELTRASFSKKALPTTIEGYFENLPVLTDVKPSVANADAFVNVENIASLNSTDRDAYLKVSSKPGAIKLASDYSWESQSRFLALNMKLGNIENIYGTNKTYEYNVNFNLNFNEDTENGYLCRLPGTYTDANTQSNQGRRNIGFFNFGSSTNLLLYRNGITSHDGGTEAVVFDNLLENGVYTLQLLYHAGEDSQKSSISVNLIYKGADGTAAPVVIPCYDRVQTKFMIGETTENVAVTTGTIGTFQAGIGAPPAGSYMEITGASLTSKNLYDTFVFKGMDYSKTGNTVTVTGTYDYTNGADERNAHVQYAALFTSDDRFVACGIANESALSEGQNVTWNSSFNYDGEITSGMKIKLFVWEDMNPAIDVQTITID